MTTIANDSNNSINIRQKELNNLVNNKFMLTTIDNPYNPFTQFDDWFAFDVLKGYNSCSYLARIVKSSPDLSEIDETLAINAAIDEIVSINDIGLYIKVTEKTFKDRSTSVIINE